jgi:DNA-binding protein H-NS
MAKSLSQIKSQIEKLQKEAEAIRASVVARLRKEMAQHGLTAEDLMGGGGDVVNNGRRPKSKPSAHAKAPKYADGTGNTWGGMGKRPAWIRTALEAGRSLEEFLVGAAAKVVTPTKSAKPLRKKAAAAKKPALARKTATSKPARAAAAPKKGAAKRPARKKAAAGGDTSEAQG